MSDSTMSANDLVFCHTTIQICDTDRSQYVQTPWFVVMNRSLFWRRECYKAQYLGWVIKKFDPIPDPVCNRFLKWASATEFSALIEL